MSTGLATPRASSEQRSGRRRATSLRCRVLEHTDTAVERHTRLSDVGPGGSRIFTASPPAIGQTVLVRFFLGDAVGYGPNPNEVCELIRSIAKVGVVGNHDAAVSGRMDYSEYYDAARHALDWCAERLTPDNMAWLEGLPYKVREGEVEFSHGAPVAPEMFDYLFAPEQVIELLDAFDALAPVTFIGHSHLTISFKIHERTVTPIIAPKIVCDPQAKYIITVGSVGQPRDRDPRTCCGTYDTDTRIFQYHRLEYDVLTTRQKIIDAGLASGFGERLLVGM